jgi:putative transposase
VGLDAGVAHTLTTNTGRHIDGPAALAASLRKLERLQQQMARQEKGSANWRKTVAKVKAVHEKIRRTRKLFAHKTTTFLLRTYETVAIEDLKLSNMVRRPAPKPAEDGQSFLPNQASAKSGLNRSMHDAGLGQLRVMLEAKGKERGRRVVPVDPRHTSQRCSACGHTDPGNRPSQALFLCLKCGHTENADVNAAKNILSAAIG